MMVEQQDSIKFQNIKVKFTHRTTTPYTTKKTKISEGNLVRENVKSLSNSVTKFCDQEICEEFQFFRH